MTDYHLGKQKSINAFVADKLKTFLAGGLTFENMFRLMFREEENILYERSEGYRIRKTTYGESKQSILRKTAWLRRDLEDLENDAVVGLYMDNSLAWIEAFWAILAAGFRPLLMNLRLPADLLTQAMRDCGCRAVISDGKVFFCRTVLAQDLESAQEREDTSLRFGSELLVMSSGTSEHVKVCAYTAEQFYYQIYESYAIIQKCAQAKRHYHGNMKLLTFLPFYHVFGLIALYIWFAFFSRTFVHLSDYAPQTIVNTIKRHQVTHIFAVPLFWEKVYDEAIRTIKNRGDETWNKFNKALSVWEKLSPAPARVFSKTAFREVRENLFGESVQFMITGGSFIDRKILIFFNAIGYRLANGYGMTEIGITSVELSPKHKYLCGGFVGGPMTYAEYSLDPSGELLVRGKVLAKYILTDGKKTVNDDWFHTNDLAVCENGHYRLLGRRDDLIIASGGENLNPNLLENRLRPGSGGEVCLIAVREDEITTPVLLVSVNRFLSGQKLTELDSEVKRLISEAGMNGQIGKIIYVGAPLLLDNEFKLNRLRLARDYAEGRLPVIDPDARFEEEASDALTAEVKACFATALGKDAEAISAEEDFFLDAGGSSLDYFALISVLRDTFELPFPMEDSNLRTVRQITDYIRTSRGNGAPQ